MVHPVMPKHLSLLDIKSPRSTQYPRVEIILFSVQEIRMYVLVAVSSV